MSEETTTDSKRKKDAPKEPDRSAPVVIDEGLTAWLENLFRDDAKCHYVNVTQIFGRQGRQIGELLKHFEFLEGGKAPPRSRLVAIANELCEAMQNEADNLRQPMMYAITAHNPQRGTPHFDRRTKEVEPKRALVKRSDNGFDPDDDENPLYATGGDVLRKRAETVLADGRFYFEQIGAMIGDFMKIAMELLKDSRSENRELREAWLKATKAQNEAENNALDRELAREDKKFLLDAKRRGINFLAGVLPGVVQTVTKGAVNPPGGKTAEAMAIDAVLDDEHGGLTDEERTRVFGAWTDDGVCTKRGILTEDQVKIIIGVKRGDRSPDELDKLIVESPDQITMEQYLLINSSIDTEKLGPLLIVFKDHKAKIEAAAKKSVPPAVPK